MSVVLPLVQEGETDSEEPHGEGEDDDGDMDIESTLAFEMAVQRATQASLQDRRPARSSNTGPDGKASGGEGPLPALLTRGTRRQTAGR